MAPVTLAQITVLILAALACVCDLRTRRIPNVVTFGGAAAALAFHTVTGGLEGAQSSLVGWAVGVAFFLPFFLLRGMGAGDVKLLGAIGAWLGTSEIFWIALYSCMAGGVLAVAVSWTHGYLGQAFRNLWCLLTYWRVAGLRPFSELTLERAAGPRLPYSLPIAMGTLVTLWIG